MKKFAVLSILLCSSAAALSDAEWHLLNVGTFPPEFVAGAPTTGWIAITTDNHLKPATIRKRRIKVDDPDKDIGAGWIEIDPSVPNTQFLIRLPQIRAGVRVRELQLSAEQRNLKPQLTFRFGGSQYSIDFSDHSDDPGDGGVFLYKNGKQKTLLKDFYIDECNYMTLSWAGDLDGDGKLDLILSNGAGDFLYLSGGAPAGQLVQEAGSFWRDEGC